ncbi:hypothetical protein NKH18_15175 [Streptomyces sp. M10(2022)]
MTARRWDSDTARWAAEAAAGLHGIELTILSEDGSHTYSPSSRHDPSRPLEQVILYRRGGQYLAARHPGAMGPGAAHRIEGAVRVAPHAEQPGAVATRTGRPSQPGPSGRPGTVPDQPPAAGHLPPPNLDFVPHTLKPAVADPEPGPEPQASPPPEAPLRQPARLRPAAAPVAQAGGGSALLASLDADPSGAKHSPTAYAAGLRNRTKPRSTDDDQYDSTIPQPPGRATAGAQPGEERLVVGTARRAGL